MKKKLLFPFLMAALFSLAACTSSVPTSSETPSSGEPSQTTSTVVSSETTSTVTTSEATSIESSVSETTSETTSEEPGETLEQVFNYGFDPEFAGDPAIAAPEEGEGFIITDQGYASTINGALEPAPAPNWTFVYTGYDKNMPEFELEAKVRYGASTNNTAVYGMRVCYDGCYDVQFSAKNNNDGWQGVQIYQAGGPLIAQHDNTEKGGLITDGSLAIVPDTDYVFKFRSVIGVDELALVTVSVNDVKVIEIGGLSTSTLNANAKHGMGASAGSWIMVDYYKGSRVIV
ncbi:MAG TPA: hypothetical protein PK340_01270 [Bacilli bacterium]|nr:hypothetical protein [Bacilli bacterium]